MNIPIEQCNFVADEIRAEKMTVLVHCQLKRDHKEGHRPPMSASGKHPALGPWTEFKSQTKGD